MKIRLAVTILFSSLSLMAGVYLVFGSVPRVAALPVNIVAAVQGDQCGLPDGSTGVIGADNRTCCPANLQAPQACLYAKYLNPVIALLAAAVGIAVVISIVYGGVEYVTSGGDPQRAAAGRKRIIEALIGLAAFIFLYAFLQFLIPGGLLNGG